MLIQQTWTTVSVQIHFEADSWAALENERSWKRQKSWTSEEMQKHQWFYSRVEGKAAVSLCFPRGTSPLPWAGRVSEPSQSRTWTWVCCPAQTVAALKKNCWSGLCTQNHFGPDRYWLWPVFWGWNFHSAVFEAERKNGKNPTTYILEKLEVHYIDTPAHMWDVC